MRRKRRFFSSSLRFFLFVDGVDLIYFGLG